MSSNKFRLWQHRNALLKQQTFFKAWPQPVQYPKQRQIPLPAAIVHEPPPIFITTTDLLLLPTWPGRKNPDRGASLFPASFQSLGEEWKLPTQQWRPFPPALLPWSAAATTGKDGDESHPICLLSKDSMKTHQEEPHTYTGPKQFTAFHCLSVQWSQEWAVPVYVCLLSAPKVALFSQDVWWRGKQRSDRSKK